MPATTSICPISLSPSRIRHTSLRIVPAVARPWALQSAGEMTYVTLMEESAGGLPPGLVDEDEGGTSSRDRATSAAPAAPTTPNPMAMRPPSPRCSAMSGVRRACPRASRAAQRRARRAKARRADSRCRSARRECRRSQQPLSALRTRDERQRAVRCPPPLARERRRAPAPPAYERLCFAEVTRRSRNRQR